MEHADVLQTLLQPGARPSWRQTQSAGSAGPRTTDGKRSPAARERMSEGPAGRRVRKAIEETLEKKSAPARQPGRNAEMRRRPSSGSGCPHFRRMILTRPLSDSWNDGRQSAMYQSCALSRHHDIDPRSRRRVSHAAAPARKDHASADDLGFEKYRPRAPSGSRCRRDAPAAVPPQREPRFSKYALSRTSTWGKNIASACGMPKVAKSRNCRGA